MTAVKKTLVIGASTNPSRYSYLATKKLESAGHPVVAFGIKEGNIEETKIVTHFPKGETFDTVTLYLRPSLQEAYIQPIIALNPSRVIFNPGTENSAFVKKLREAGIAFENACTLVLLNTHSY